MKRIFLLTAVAVCATIGVMAQQADSISIYQNIQQVEVTAIRAKGDTPIAHTNLSRSEIEERNYGEDIPSLLATMPSVVISSESGMGLGSTSFRVRGTDPSRINVTLNGVPLEEGTGYTYNETTGEFATVAGVITVPAATYTRQADGSFVTVPGEATLVVVGSI